MIKIVFVCDASHPYRQRSSITGWKATDRWYVNTRPRYGFAVIHRGIRSPIHASTPRWMPVVAKYNLYDGVAEVYRDDIEDLVDAFSTEEGQAAGMALLADEQTFIDLPNSSMFFAEEHEIVPG